MKTAKKIAWGVFSLALFTLFACEQPFKAGLGPVVDTRPPTVRLDSPGVGDYIWGQTEFKGFAEDDYKLDRVMIKITNHPGNYNQYQDYVQTNMVSSSNGRWNITIDTIPFPEGAFKIQLIVYDSVGKFTETGEIAFNVKNAPPVINVASPYIPRAIAGRDREGEAGGSHLNFEITETAMLPISGVGFQRQADKGSFLAGTIRDDEDIYTGGASANRYPPQYRLWKIPEEADVGTLPSETKVPWQSFNREELFMLGIGNYQFIYEIPSEVGYYGFEIRAQSKDGRTGFWYPRDYYPGVKDWDNYNDVDDLAHNPAYNEAFKRENRYVLIYIRSPRELPTLELYGQENIFGRFESGNYPDMGRDEPHPYVDKPNGTVNKKDDFTIWIKATHSDGIGTAEIYWEKADRSERGRFIWDWEPLEWAQKLQQVGSQWITNQGVDETFPYSYWGYRDPNFGGGSTTRNFIFNFDPDGSNRVPAGYNGAGRSKIQRYTGDAANWQVLKKAGGLPENNTYFEDVTENGRAWLPNGTYNIEVYAHSLGGTPVPVPLTFTICMDRTPPSIEITNVEGAYDQDTEFAIVNGVVKTHVLISDSESYDSGLRSGNAPYFDNGYEQFYILINDADKSAIDAHLNANPGWWPEDFPALPDSAWSNAAAGLPAGIGVEKHGPILGGAFKFKASPTRAGDTDALADGTYWIYIFARDNTFNVGRNDKPFKIIVDHATDKPTLNIRGTLYTTVTLPDKADDGKTDIDGNPTGFNGATINILQTAPITFDVTDDDGMNISSIQASIYSTSISTDGKIQLNNPPKSITFNKGTDRKKQTLTITQNQMYRALNPGALAGAALPDGIYRLHIEVEDDPDYKLIMNYNGNVPIPAATLNRADAVKTEVDFFFAVETTPPAAEITGPLDDHISSGMTLSATVEDANGPIKPTVELRHISGTSYSVLDIDYTFTRDASKSNVWYYNLAAVLDLKDLGGDFNVVMVFEDRFGRTSSVSRRYKVDDEPPVVSLRKPIPTFARSGNVPEDVILTPTPGLPAAAMADRSILANGVAGFVIQAQDPGGVAGVRWWLLPYDISVTNFDKTSVQGAAGTEVKDKFMNLTPIYSSNPAANVRTGAIIDRFTANNNNQFIDLGGLPDGRYILWVAASDDAANVFSQKMQEIYILKEEDKPYFGKNGTPGNPQDIPNIYPSLGVAVSGDNLTISGTIVDDDGFSLDTSTLKFWLRTDDSGSDVAPMTGHDSYYGNYYVDNGIDLSEHGYTEKSVRTADLTSNGGKNITFRIPVKDNYYFPGTLEDREYQYILEATDTLVGKFKSTSQNGTDGTPEDDVAKRVTRRKHFTFAVDELDPVIVLTHPDGSEGTFGGKAVENLPASDPDYDSTLYLKGSIADANLARINDPIMGNDSYYIKLQVGSSPEIHTVALGRGVGLPTNSYITALNTTTSPNLTTVDFCIPAGKVTDLIDFLDSPDGNYTLIVMVEDTSRKRNSQSVSFFKDSRPPDISFNNIDPVMLPSGTGTGNWWNTGYSYGGKTGQPARKQWLQDNTGDGKAQLSLTVLHYEAGSNPPSLKGSFSDDFSSIKISSLHYALDNSTVWQALPLTGTPGSGKTVSWEIPLSGLGEGIHTVRFQAEDSGSNPFNDVIYYGFRLNSSLPAVSVTPLEPLVYGDTVEDVVFTLEGAAQSPNLANVRVDIRYVDDRNSSQIPSNNGGFSILLVPAAQGITNVWDFTDPVLEKLTWSVGISKENIRAAANNAINLVQGYYEITVVSTDLTGAESNEQQLNFTIDTSASRDVQGQPRFDFGELKKQTSNANIGPTWWLRSENRNDRNVLMGANPKIQVRISDEYSELAKVQRQIRRFNYSTGGWEYRDISVGAAAAGAWTTTEDPDNDFWQDISDAEKKMNYPLDWELNNLNNGLISAEGQMIKYGYYSVRLRAKDSAYIDGVDGWEPHNDGNPSVSDFVYFFYTNDRTADLEFTLPAAAVNTVNAPGGNLELSGKLINADGNGNRFERLEVSVESVNTGVPNRSYQPLEYPFAAVNPDKIDDTWEWTARPNNEFNGCPDGSYRLILTVYDLAGRTSVFSRVITLDNTPPAATFEVPTALTAPFTAIPANLPAGYSSSEVILGGASQVISGTTADRGERGSASGVKEVWYHLGYIGSGGSEIINSSGLNFPTRTQIHNSFNGVEGRNAWFKYTGHSSITGNYENGTVRPSADFSWGGTDPYGWALNIADTGDETGLKLLATSNYRFSGAGNETTSYNTIGGPWLVQRIDTVYNIQTNVRKPGLYSLPVYIRVEDFAGNYEYYCFDIWIYPDGDYPTSVFINPASTVTQTGDVPREEARGGMIVVEGSASDNVSVKDVIYRVWVDDIYNWNLQENPLTNARIVEQADDSNKLTDAAILGRIPPGIGENGWYKAELDSPDALSTPWNFRLNSQDEFLELIEKYGFASSGNGKDMIRVCVEVLVFDGDETGGYHYMSFGDNKENPQPYRRVFFIKNSSPKIESPQISRKQSGSNTAAFEGYENFNQGAIRGGRFAIQAALDGKGRSIGLIAIKRSDMPDSNWITVYPPTAQGYQALPGLTIPAPVNNRTTVTYQFDSTASASGFGFIQNGAWSESGGPFTVSIRLRDDSSPPGNDEYTFEIGIDNFAPLADPDLETRTPSKVAGTNVSFQGRVFDYSKDMGNLQPNAPYPYNKIQRIYAWFTKGNYNQNYINLSAKMTPQNGIATTSMLAYTGRSARVQMNGNSVAAIDNVVNGSRNQPIVYPTDARYVKVIDEASAAFLENKMFWQGTDGDRDVLWTFMQDTTLMPDGPIYLNYLVVDSAGNAAFYRQNTVVMNNYPQITAVTLHTNNRGEGAAFSTHEEDEAYSRFQLSNNIWRREINGALDTTINHNGSGYLNSGFISKNQTIGFGVETISGNAPMHYQVRYVKRESLTLDNAALQNMANRPAAWPYVNLYTIEETGDADKTAWETMGLNGDPAPGKHFVYKAAADAFGTGATGTGYTSKVWAYRDVFPGADVLNPDNGKKTVQHNIRSNPDTSWKVDPEDLYFVGGTYFGSGGSQINEFKGSQPGMGSDDKPAQTAFFLIKAWDTVNEVLPSEGGNEEDMLYDAVVVGMNVYLYDSEPPTIRLYDLNPYTEIAVIGNNVGDTNRRRTMAAAADPGNGAYENIRRGGLFNVNTERELVKSGHIEPRNNTTALRPLVNGVRSNAAGFISGDSDVNSVDYNGMTDIDLVSGKVILRGVAWDDQLIREIRIQMTGEAASTAILSLQGTGTNRTMQPVGDTLAWASEKMHWKDGHTVEWAYIWDTENRPIRGNGGGPVQSITITVSVMDEKGSESGNVMNGPGLANAGTIDAPAEVHNRVTVGIVPYITHFQRYGFAPANWDTEQPRFTTSRSRQGWYSFYQNEANIAVRGYNLLSTGAATTMNIQYGAANNTPLSVTNQTVNRIIFTVPDNAQSGKINLSVGGLPVLNHITDHKQSWNREYHSYTGGSELWVNKPYAHIWRSQQSAATTTPYTYMARRQAPQQDDTVALDSPSMAIEYVGNVGRLHGAWTVFGETGYFYGKNDNLARNTLYINQTDPYTYTDISISNGGGIANSNINVVSDYIYDGQPQIGIKTVMNNTNGFNGISPAANRPTERWKNPRIAKALNNGATNEGNAGRVFITAYDAQNGYLWFARREGTTSTNNNTYQYIIDGGAAATGAIDGFTQISTANKSTNAGEYSAVDFDATGPVVAYYDQVNDTVRLAYASTMTPNSGNWTRREILSGDLYRGSGKYISMKIDKNNGIHLAFFNSVYNTVVYAYASSRTGTFTAHTVDRVVNSGYWTDISVDDNGNPYIVYGNNGRMGNFDGVRIAYRTGRAGSNNGVQFNNIYDSNNTTANPAYGWEALSMPANFMVSNDRLNIEAWPPTNRVGGTLGTRPAANGTWNAAIGYAGTDTSNMRRFQLAYFTNPAWKDY